MNKGVIICVLLVGLISSSTCKITSWDPIQRISENEVEKRLPLVHFCPTTNVTHIFWEEIDNKKDLYLMYRVRLPNSTLTPTRCLDQEHPLAYYENVISVQSTDDGMHLFLAYGAYRVRSGKGCTKRNDDSCIEVFFTESTDGGATWSKPVRINRKEMYDTKHRCLPSMVFEKATGRIWIAYYIDMYAGMVVRRPDAKEFESEQSLSLYMFGRILHMGYTHDSNANLTWLHMVWWEDDINRTKSIYYSRSNDSAENWARRNKLVDKYKGDNLPTIAVDNIAYEGAVYVQYSDEKEINILWSKDHGATWETKLKAGNAYTAYNAISICGRKGKKGKVFTTGPGMGIVSGFQKYFNAGDTDMTSLSYPFNTYKKIADLDIHCSIKENGEIVVNSIIFDSATNELYLAHGIFDKIVKSEY